MQPPATEQTLLMHVTVHFVAGHKGANQTALLPTRANSQVIMNYVIPVSQTQNR